MPAPFAFVSLVTSDRYLPGALALAAALKDQHPTPQVDFQTVCLVTPENVDVSTIKLLRRAFNVVIGVELIEQEDKKGLQLLDMICFTPRAGTGVAYQKIIFLDADVLPIRPLSQLFSIPHEFAAVPDVGWPDIFNSGVLVLTPGQEKFNELSELLKTKGSWDGGDQGLLNEWRGGDWHRLSFTYNTTPTAAYTYAPAYERFGSQISAIHFIGPSKPWASLQYRAPGTKNFQQQDSTTSREAGSQQAYDYDSLVDRWYDVYDRHYRSDAPTARAEFELTRYASAWDDHGGGELGAELPPVPVSVTGAPPGGAFGLDELRRIAVEGMSNMGGSVSVTEHSVQEGEYRSLPLHGRLDLMRPRPEPKPHVEEEHSHRGQDDQGRDDRDLTPTQEHKPLHLEYKPLHLGSSGDSEFRTYTLPTPGPNEVPPAPYHHGGSLPPTPTYSVPSVQRSSQQGVQQLHQEQGWHQSTLDQHGKHHHHQLPSFRPPLPQNSSPEHDPAPLPPAHHRHSPSRSPQSQSPSYHQHHHQHHPQNQPLQHQPQHQPQQQQPQHHQQHQHQHPHQQQQQQQHLPQQQQHQPQHQHHAHHSPPRPRSPPKLSWNPAVEPPPNNPPAVNAFPTDTYFPNVWDQTPSREHDAVQQSFPLSPGPHVPAPQSDTFFHPPPPSRIPEQLVRQGQYSNIFGQAPPMGAGSPPAQPVPNPQKVHAVFPWEGKPQHIPKRVFPASDVPPPTVKYIENEAKTIPRRDASGEARSRDQAQDSEAGSLLLLDVTPPAPHVQAPSPPIIGMTGHLTYANAWDTVPSIQKYASKLVRPHHQYPFQHIPYQGGTPHRRSALGADDEGWRRWEKERERNVQARQDASSMDGDDEDDGDDDDERDDQSKKDGNRASGTSGTSGTRSGNRSRSGSSASATVAGKGKKYRGRGIQTIPVEVRHQAVQVKIRSSSVEADGPKLRDTRQPPPSVKFAPETKTKHDMASSPIIPKARLLPQPTLLPPAPVDDLRNQMGQVTPGISQSVKQTLPYPSTASPTGLRSPQMLGSPRTFSPPKTQSPQKVPSPPQVRSPTRGSASPKIATPPPMSGSASPARLPSTPKGIHRAQVLARQCLAQHAAVAEGRDVDSAAWHASAQAQADLALRTGHGRGASGTQREVWMCSSVVRKRSSLVSYAWVLSKKASAAKAQFNRKSRGGDRVSPRNPRLFPLALMHRYQNVPELPGAQLDCSLRGGTQQACIAAESRWETSAAWQQAEMTSKKLSDEVGKNANATQVAAQQAAAEAQQIKPQIVSAVNELEAQRQLSGSTTQAANQGKLDLEAAQGIASNTAAVAVEQAKNLASSAYATAQSLYDSQAQEGSATRTLASTVQSTAQSALQTGKDYLASAQTAAQPHIEQAKTYVAGSVQTGANGTATGKPGSVPTSTAPLESGPHVVGDPYPVTVGVQTTKIGEF
ncbi:hypothetical protein C8Q72DRAFT_795635 [Fomitopsis betulina]|nr:hypothetical protein C8Q72DRAFT_795635 [Fomitopsis betulina]